ncbi:ABC transporter permease [Actinokineospora enzanensis]|uniref:ABC transporter permease n=1 Tax=Actinokineospora enzanensis TaxID=155975 RepID=UPI000361CB7F|nr:ABC transporter permease [Actinokineospora enzanensis]
MTTHTLRDAYSAELLKLRSLRSTRTVPAAALLAVVAGAVLAILLTNDFDASPPDLRAHFASADPSILITPVLGLALAAIAAPVFTAEYGTGAIRATMIGVPARRKLFTAKALTVASIAAAAGMVVSFALYALTTWVVGDRPAPLAPWPTPIDGVPSALANGTIVVVVALLALGLGAALRSTAGALVTVTLLLFVLPGLGLFLPPPATEWITSMSLVNLAPAISGTTTDTVLSPAAAVIVALAYAAVPLALGWLRFSRRDA